MLTRTDEFIRLLTKKLEEEIQREAEILCAGAMGDFPEYRMHAGIITGLKRCQALCDDVQTELAKRP